MEQRVRHSSEAASGHRASWWRTAIWVLIPCLLSIACWVRRRRPAGGRRPVERPDTVLAPAATDEESATTISQRLLNQLGAIRGYCEIAKMKNPEDENLVYRMDAAMESCDEACAMIRKLARRPPPAAARLAAASGFRRPSVRG